MTQTKSLAGALLVAIGLVVPWSVQQRALSAARAENAALRSDASGAAATPATAARTGADEEAARERADLERLRREVPELRRQLAALPARPDSVPDPKPGANPSAEPAGPGATIRLTDLSDVGQATPVALLQTHLWAMLRGDTNRLVAIADLPPEADRELFARTLGEMRKESERGEDVILAELPLGGIRVVGEEPAGNGDVWLVHEFLLKTGEVGERARVRVRSTPAGWKLVFGLDSQPVQEHLGREIDAGELR